MNYEGTFLNPVGSNASFSNPFYDIASQYIPRNIKNAFRWAEYLYCVNSVYAPAVCRIARYLITELEITGQNNAVSLRYKLLFDKMNMRQTLATIGIASLVYGNVFVSVALPFDRFLRCPRCPTERLAKAVEYDFYNYEYILKCPCGYYGPHERVDKYSNDVVRTKILLWDPKKIEIESNAVGDKQYFVHLDSILRHKLQHKHKFTLDTTPWEFIECIRKDELFQFKEGSLLHIANETLPGFSMHWGLPSSIFLFRLHYQAAVLRKANEAIALDYILPFRIMYPSAQSAASDPAQVMGLSNFTGRLEEMVKRHRIDPTYTQVSPVPIGYEAIGAEGKQLNVSPELKALNEEILNGAGFPAELFYGTLQVQALPAALRLFENTWEHLYHGYNSVLQMIANKVSSFFNWPPTTVRLKRVTLVDDMERKQLLMQIAAAGQGAQTSFFEAFNLDWRREMEKMFREQFEVPEMQKRIAEEYKVKQQEQQGVGATPMDITMQAQQLAQQALANPMGSRQLLHQLNQSDKQLYAMVKMYMDQIRSQMSSQAGRQALQMGLMAAGAGGVTGGGVTPMSPMGGGM